MQFTGPIRAINLHILDFCHLHVEAGSISRTETLAKARVSAKFEEPRTDTDAQRRKDAWQKWISFDENLQIGGILGPYWAKARLLIHQILYDFRMGDLAFTNGSSFEPLGNRVSVACRLTETWTITSDCFDLFAAMSYRHRALKHSVKKRFTSYCKQKNYSERARNKILWSRFKNKTEPAFEIYRFKLFCVVTFVHGNRYSTVPKNNLKDRSICLEPLCNMFVQRAVGLGIRRCLKDKLGIDLDTLADVHRARISDSNVATIDLSDASDSISMGLIQYLIPFRVFSRICACRSDMTLGPDGDYYVTSKVSSMGNGFTFDLMTLVLTALTRSFDPTATVFGDDIICQNQEADGIIENLTRVGFNVNLKKTNIRSDYRESCGAHFIDGEGYLTSFDIHWIKTPHDMVVTLNKLAIMSSIYGGHFESLRSKVWSCVPRSLLGATIARPIVDKGKPPEYDLDTFVRYGPVCYVDPPRAKLRSIRKSLHYLNKSGRVSIATAFLDKQAPSPSNLKAYDWDIYFQYIYSSRKTRKIAKSVLKSTIVARVDEELIGLISALRPERV
jgi:hypothetical protein